MLNGKQRKNIRYPCPMLNRKQESRIIGPFPILNVKKGKQVIGLAPMWMESKEKNDKIFPHAQWKARWIIYLPKMISLPHVKWK